MLGLLILHIEKQYRTLYWANPLWPPSQHNSECD